MNEASDRKLDQILREVQTLNLKAEERLARYETRVEQHHRTLYGDRGTKNLGLVGDVKSLEDTEQTRRRHLAALWAAVTTAIGAALTNMLGGGK